MFPDVAAFIAINKGWSKQGCFNRKRKWFKHVRGLLNNRNGKLLLDGHERASCSVCSVRDYRERLSGVLHAICLLWSPRADHMIVIEW